MGLTAQGSVDSLEEDAESLNQTVLDHMEKLCTFDREKTIEVSTLFYCLPKRIFGIRSSRRQKNLGIHDQKSDHVFLTMHHVTLPFFGIPWQLFHFIDFI